MSSDRPLRLLIVTGTRADFGLWHEVIVEAERRPSEVGVRLLVSGMHLDERFGGTIAEIRASGTPIAAEIPFTAPGDSRLEMAASLGHALTGFAPAIDAEAPDWLLLLGDRGEQLAAALVGVHLGLPIAHLHGGERTLGAVDDTLRDMISRAAQLHLVATSDAADRLQRMGEASWRIHVVGAPGLDAIAAITPAGPEQRRAVGLPADGPYALLVQHPETVGGRDGVVDLDASLEAVSAIDLPVLAVAPNADAGGRAMFERLRAAGVSALHASLPRDDFLALLGGASVLIGNSSAALIEAPLLGVPAVNVGDRQRGRTRGDNVIDVPADREQIVTALRKATDPSFRASLSRRSPYGDGHSAPRILDAIVAQPIDERLMVKEVAP